MNVTFATAAGEVLVSLQGDRSLGERDVPVVRDLSDWYSVPPSKAALEERPQAHGAFVPGPDWRQAAAPQVQGWFMGSTRAAVRAFKTSLAGLLARGELLRVTVTDGDETTSRLVSIRNVDFPDDRGRDRCQFAIDMLAPDPRRYSPAQEIRKELALYQGGNLAINPSNELGVFNWSAEIDGVPKAVEWGSGGGFVGDRFARVTVAADAATVIMKLLTPVFQPVSAHTNSIRVATNRPRPLRLTITYASSAQIFETITMFEAEEVGPAWHLLALVDNPIPAGATQNYITIDSLGGDPWLAGDWIAADGAMVGLTTDYADGDTEGWTWDGVPGESASVDSERIKVTNDGTADTSPVFKLEGGMPNGFTITEMETGRQIRFGKPIPDGAETIIDPEEGVLLVNGVPTYGLTRYGWPIVPAGSTRHYMVTQTPRVPIFVNIDLAAAWW